MEFTVWIESGEREIGEVDEGRDVSGHFGNKRILRYEE